MTDVKMTIDDVLALRHVMPVIVIDDAYKAVPLAETLLANGIRTIEITLRTPAALDSIAAIADQCPEQGLHAIKFFPAMAAGGSNFIKSLASPLPHLTFCPTGGITEATAPDWLSLPNVPCLGGSWIAPATLINAGDWDTIGAHAKAASQL